MEAETVDSSFGAWMTDELYQFSIKYAQMGNVLYKRRLSMYVPEDQAFVVKQNDEIIWVVSGRILSFDEFMSVIRRYAEKTYEPSP